MTDSSTNPFVLPGMGQSSNLSGNPLLASMEMMKQAWSGLAGPGGLAQALPMTAPMNLEDLERRIADLRAVEGWLRMNLSMLGSTIQGMEVQRATIATLRSFIDSAASIDTSSAPAPGQPTPLEIVLGLKPAPQEDKPAGATAAASAATSSSPEAPAGESAGPGAEALDSAARSASQAWWGLLQQQFNNIAQATVASMSSMAPATEAAAQQGSAEQPQAAPAGGGSRAADPSAAKTAKPAAKKSAARKAPARKAAARKTAAKPAADKT